jgi:hypothetical protein
MKSDEAVDKVDSLRKGVPSTPFDTPSQSRIAALKAALRDRFWRCFSNGKAAGKTFSTD